MSDVQLLDAIRLFAQLVACSDHYKQFGDIEISVECFYDAFAIASSLFTLYPNIWVDGAEACIPDNLTPRYKKIYDRAYVYMLVDNGWG